MLFLQTFGGISLFDEERHPLVGDQRRRLALLTLIAIAGKSGLSRDKIVAYLWPESSTENARHALHQLLYCLRRETHPDIFLGPDPLRLNPKVVTSDVVQFTDALSAGLLENAVALYSGQFLDGFFLNGAAEFEKWVEQQRARLHADYTSALYRLAKQADQSGAHATAVERWRALVGAEPTAARATLGLMRALAASGDPNAALRHARVYENLLHEEVGDAPAAEIIAYADELKAMAAETNARNGVHAPDVDTRATPGTATVPAASTPLLRISRVRVFAAGMAAVAVLLAIVAGYAAFHSDDADPRAFDASETAAPALAIMPFGVSDTTQQTWRNGAPVLLATAIDGVAGLRAIDQQAIVVALRGKPGAYSFGSSAPDRDLTLNVAQRTGARYALVGNVVTNGSAVRISANLYKTANGRRLRQFQVEGRTDQMFALLDQLATDVLHTMLQRERKEDDLARVELARKATTSLPALKAYLEGEEHHQASRFGEAAEAYARALEIDSTFVLILTRFLVPYSFVSAPKSVPDPLGRARRQLDRLPPREALLVRASDVLSRGDIPECYALLRQASQQYPDDFEIWYSLGEITVHDGGRLLLSPDDAIRAFSNSVRLNPTFGPSYYHLLELLIGQRGDSAAAATAAAAYSRIAPEGENRPPSSVAFALAFGSPSERRSSLAALDTMNVGMVVEVAGFLAHPTLIKVQEHALAIMSARVGEPTGDPMFAGRVSLYRGSLSSAISNSLKYDRCPPFSIYWAYLYGKSRLPPEGDAALQPGAAASFGCSPLLAALLAGAYAADRARWPDFEQARSQLLTSADKWLSEGDSVRARTSNLLAEVLRGYGLARTGKLDEGIAALQSVQPRLPSNTNTIVRWWLGTLLLQANRPLEARPYFAAFWYWQHENPVPASYYLGRIDEKLGRSAEARAEYTRFANAWRHADPDIQPLISDARARIASLAHPAKSR